MPTKPTEIAKRAAEEIKKLEKAGSWVPMVLERMEELAKLPADWDSYGSAGLQIGATNAACKFLLEGPSRSLPVPHVTLVPGGGLGFHWRVETRDLEVEFMPAGSVEYLMTTTDGTRPPEEGVLDSSIDLRVWNWLVGA